MVLQSKGQVYYHYKKGKEEEAEPIGGALGLADRLTQRTSIALFALWINQYM